MALAHNPKVATNGLIFYYDMENTDKSFKGKPTTNLITSTINNWTGSSLRNATLLDEKYNGGNVYRLEVSAGADPATYVDAYFMYNVPNLSVGDTFTFSADVRVIQKATATAQTTPADNGFWIWYAGTSEHVNFKNLTLNEWTRIEVTATVGSTYDYIWARIDHDNSIVDITNIQLEQQSFATPFTEGTRSSTEAILDMTKNPTTITPTNLTYDSDGTFEFDGTDDYIDLPNNLGYTTQVSPFAWFKSSGTPAGNYHIVMGGQELEISIHSSDYLRVGVYQGSRFVSNHGTGILDGNWHYIGFTFDGSTKTAYIDGESVGTQSVSAGTLSTSFSRRIGRFGTNGTYYANGQIGAVQIYNRSLTSDEVKNNYNALRRRYGV